MDSMTKGVDDPRSRFRLSCYTFVVEANLVFIVDHAVLVMGGLDAYEHIGFDSEWTAQWVYCGIESRLSRMTFSSASTAYPVAASVMNRPMSLSASRDAFREEAHQLPSFT
jgi:hypothetical protein